MDMDSKTMVVWSGLRWAVHIQRISERTNWQREDEKHKRVVGREEEDQNWDGGTILRGTSKGMNSQEWERIAEYGVTWRRLIERAHRLNVMVPRPARGQRRTKRRRIIFNTAFVLRTTNMHILYRNSAIRNMKTDKWKHKGRMSLLVTWDLL